MVVCVQIALFPVSRGVLVSLSNVAMFVCVVTAHAVSVWPHVSLTVAHECIWQQDDTQSWHIVGRTVPWIACAFAFLLVFLAVIAVHLSHLSGCVYLAILHSNRALAFSHTNAQRVHIYASSW